MTGRLALSGLRISVALSKGRSWVLSQRRRKQGPKNRCSMAPKCPTLSSDLGNDSILPYPLNCPLSFTENIKITFACPKYASTNLYVFLGVVAQRCCLRET